MRFSLKVSVAVHILLVIQFFSENARVTGRLLTVSTGCNPVVVRTLVVCLKNAGILEVTRGPHGGTRLLKDPADISLWDVYSAVDPEAMDALVKGIHTTSNQICPVGRGILDVLRAPYFRVAEAIEAEMRDITLEEISNGLSMEEILHHRQVLLKARADGRPYWDV